MKWRLVRKAGRDLIEIDAYISLESPGTALAVAEKLRKAFRLIADRPDIGRPTSISNIREWSVPRLPYLIPYRIRTTHIEILRVWHTSRQRPDTWQ